MRHSHHVLTTYAPDYDSGYAAQSNLAGDQWVATEHNGARATGRVVSIRRSADGGVLYEVELPLLSSHRGMTRVLRNASQVIPIGGGYAEPRLALRTYEEA